MSNPLCPVTGEPAARLVQWIDAGFLAELWRIEFKTDARPSFKSQKQFGLWESPSGLYFVDPAYEGDHEFYLQLYSYLIAHKLWARAALRDEYARAAKRIRPGDRVLDVGCGDASFRGVIPEASYVGLDPNMAAFVDGVLGETLAEHLREHAGSYDAVCAFQVVEHVTAPREMFAEMVRAAKPGGLVMIGVPQVPSALTRIPNFLINAPPHHLTWWTKEALAVLATRCGATVESIEAASWTEYDSLVYWISRCCPIRCRDVHFRHAWSWHAATLIGFLLGRLMYAVRPLPKTRDEGAGLLLVARRTS